MPPRQPAGRFLGPAGIRHTPLRRYPTVADPPNTVDRIREARDLASEPEMIGPAILESYAQVNRRILTQHLVLEVADAQERRPALTPQNRLDTVHQRAKHAHVDLSHPIHLVQRAIDKARLRDQPVNTAALTRLTGLEALLDGVSIQRQAA